MLSSGFRPRDNDLNCDDIYYWEGTLAPEALTVEILALFVKFALRDMVTESVGCAWPLLRLFPIRLRFLFSVTRLDSSFLPYCIVYWAPLRWIGLMAEVCTALAA